MEIIACACGCGALLERYDKKGRERIYIHGHHNRVVRYWAGKEFSEEHKKKLSDKKLENPTQYWLGKEFSKEHRARISDGKKGQKGILSPSWIDGRTPLNHLIRSSVEMREWRMLVFSRDGFECVICGSKISLHAHHIKKF